ncbi:MAG: HD-GYP domain-containing protein [Phycisphaerae bacterium]
MRHAVDPRSPEPVRPTTQLAAAGAQALPAAGPGGHAALVARSTSVLPDVFSSLRPARLEAVLSLVAALEAKDAYTQRHSMNVSIYAMELAQALGLPDDPTEHISLAALLHDIGKIGTPDAILTKPDRLTRAEYAVVKRHPEIGAALVQQIPSLSNLANDILHHHERYDGRGYPAGLVGEEIPLGARIIHVADSMEAMLSPRCYDSGSGVRRVLSELRRGRSSQFDPRVADAATIWLTARPPLPATSWWAPTERQTRPD